MELCRAGGEDRGGYDNSRDANELVHGVGREVAKAQEVEPGVNGYLDFGDGEGGFGAFVGGPCEGEEDGVGSFCGCIFELRRLIW